VRANRIAQAQRAALQGAGSSACPAGLGGVAGATVVAGTAMAVTAARYFVTCFAFVPLVPGCAPPPWKQGVCRKSLMQNMLPTHANTGRQYY